MQSESRTCGVCGKCIIRDPKKLDLATAGCTPVDDAAALRHMPEPLLMDRLYDAVRNVEKLSANPDDQKERVAVV